MNNIVPFTILREDTCLLCNSTKSLECYDVNNRPVGFTNLLETNKIEYINNRELSHIKCSKCGKQFMLNWSNKNIPRPLIYKAVLQEFLENY